MPRNSGRKTMIHIYECNSYNKDNVIENTYWEVYKAVIGEPWNDEFLFDLIDQKDFDEYLDEIIDKGLDFMLHDNEEAYDDSSV
jgi:hypothetical protein